MQDVKPTVVLVHGAFADSSSWDGVARRPCSRATPTAARLVPLAAGGTDAYIAPDRYHRQFAADMPAAMAITQRPVTVEALNEPSGADPRWRDVPSWFLFGELDRNIPAGAHRIMAERARSRKTVELAGASHVVGISHDQEAAAIILEAAGARTMPTPDRSHRGWRRR